MIGDAMSEYDRLLDRLLDDIIGAETDDAMFALLGCLVVVIHKLDDPERGLQHLERTRRVYDESFGTTRAPSPMWWH